MKKKALSPAEIFLSAMFTGMLVQFFMDLCSRAPSPDCLQAQWVELIAALAAIASTIISSAASSSDADAASAEAKRLARIRRADEMRKRRADARQTSRELQLERRKLEHNEEIVKENERARREERLSLEKQEKLRHQKAIAGIMVPEPEQDTIQEEKQKVWGL